MRAIVKTQIISMSSGDMEPPDPRSQSFFQEIAIRAKIINLKILLIMTLFFHLSWLRNNFQN